MKFLYVARRVGIVFFLVIKNAAAQQPAAPPRNQPGRLEGLWQGLLPASDGEAAISFSLVTLTGGHYFAALDVPAQKLARVATEVKEPAGTDSVLLLVPQLGGRLLARRSADGEQLSGLWCRPGQRTPLVLRHSALPSATAPMGRLPPPYREEDVAFPNFTARLRLAGTLTVPAGPGPFPAVVLVSDLGEQDRDGLPPTKGELDPMTSLLSYRLLGSLADYLTRHGVAVLRFDDRGVGHSEGSNAAATPTHRAGDVQAALNFMRTRPEVDLLRLGLLGHGEGANVALLVAEQPVAPAFVVGLGAYGQPGYETLLLQQAALLRARKVPQPQLDQRLSRQRLLYDIIRYPTDLKQTQTMAANLLQQTDPGLAPGVAQTQAAALLTPWHRAFLSFDPLETLNMVHCPVLLITGQLDEQAPPAQHLAVLERELRSAGNHAVTVLRPRGINHLLQPPQIEWTMLSGEMKPIIALPVENLLRQWLVAQLKM
ncbi:hypothetical protein GO988_10985 [Hymenobacter sp. HMF4947]|uniref:Serine aminopeptidase S33 domain-containing protein n=1 Tax=Hymenobacter ginkgonis TaxID=2682976 RepID=A0A7K1TEM0_9BACT|nr:alpha/beta hydrolase [Hymenobacter ginkgonis]MVN76848.1 hypothetical protein [Hymenobacter ginkgonis]